MKTIRILVAMLCAFASFQAANAQSDKTQRNTGIKTQNIKVYGECGMCKKRIEKAAYTVDGVQSAVWDENSKILTLKYNQFKKAAADSVQKKIALAGHYTEIYKATHAAYNSLPDCCHYARSTAKQ